MRYSKANLAPDTTFMFHAAWCSAGASDYTAKVSGDQVGFTKNVLFFIQFSEQLVCLYTKQTIYFSSMLELA